MKSTMRQSLTPLLLLAAMAGGASADPFFDFYGYSYLDGAPFSVGTVTTVPMRLNVIQPEPPLPLDFQQYEYTVILDGATIVDVLDAYPVLIVSYGETPLRIHEDPAKNSQWTPWPPNADVPGTFTDGPVALEGTVSDLVLIFDLLNQTGVVQGSMAFTGGTRYVELSDPNGWLFFGGTTSDPSGQIPDGYDMAWDPQLLGPAPVPTRGTSWGGIRGMYR